MFDAEEINYEMVLGAYKKIKSIKHEYILTFLLTAKSRRDILQPYII